MLNAPIVRRTLPAASPAATPSQQPTFVQSKPSSHAHAVAADTGVPQSVAKAATKQRVASLKDAARIAAQQVERDLILDSLRRMRWNRKETAKLLGVSYKTLLAKIRENGLDDEYPDAAPLQGVS
jgi:DNA-binding NtrC family response regulator